MPTTKHDAHGSDELDDADLDYESAVWIAQLISDGIDSLAAAIEEIQEATAQGRRLPDDDIAGEISRALLRVDELFNAYESATIWDSE